MKLNRKAERLVTLARETVFPPRYELHPEEDAAQERAVAVWRDLFQPFGPLVEDADILEVGCADGRLASRLVTHGAARSATGVEPGFDFGPYDTLEGRLTLSSDLAVLDTLDDGVFDLVLARDVDTALPLDGLERRLGRIYELLRPGGEAVLRVGCFAPGGRLGEGPGYGLMTPTAWAAVVMRAGFEIIDSAQVWRDDRNQSAVDIILPDASPTERACAEMRLHLVRPWESWELAALTARRSKRRR
ncbi:class I SAM-dependent methyltransferase [Brevundimonas lutea]|uniref:methyltransferase domain-containing protein n=1 Tax=Brevundimonas lutea TaxID=2293980 RepID=UPI0013CE4293|nr:class I SAM-dependent methyltransferase [Brevundimonas lutea]